MLEIIFWWLTAFIFYIYFGYPLLLSLFCNKKSILADNKEGYSSVTFITIAYNEEDYIKDKIENSFSIDYPSDKFEIIIVSDGSTDKTAVIAVQYQNNGIKFLKFNVRRGKASCLNDAVSAARGELLVFSDANVYYDKDAIRKLVRNFQDKRIGAVTGEVRYVLDKNSTNQGEGLYEKYERFLRIKESNLYSLVGVNGAMYAIRRNLYVPLKKDIITDDFLVALNIIAKGYRIAYEPDAKGIEMILTSAKDEFRRKVRIIAGGYQAVKELGWKLMGFPLPVVFELISHKLLRWLAPFFLLGILIVNIFLLNISLYRALFYIQTLFYASVFLGYILEKMKLNNPFSFLYYFTVVNFASICGLFKFLTGTQKVTWSRGR